MPEAPSDPATDRTYEFDVAASFADEDREYVEEVVNGLKAEGARVFYDRDQSTAMWGEDLVEYFDEVFRLRARFALVFISQHYARKMWTRHERRSVLARSIEDDGPYLLPVRLDDTELPGLRSTLGYLDARRFGSDGVVAAVLEKLGTRSTHSLPPINRVPRSETERQRVLLEQPPGWEYLLFASLLLHGKETLEPKYRDHELGFARRTGEAFTEEAVPNYLSAMADDSLRLMRTFEKLLQSDAQERAFGRPGEPGDPERIQHLAARWTSVYEELLEWPARLRGAAVPEKFVDVVQVLAHFNDRSIQNYRSFVGEFVQRIDQLPQAIERGEPVTIEMEITMEVGDDLVRRFNKKLRAIRR